MKTIDMFRRYTILLCVVAVCILFWNTVGQSQTYRFNIIPHPVKIESHTGRFTLTNKTAIVYNFSDKEVTAIAEYLARQLRTATGYDVPLVDEKSKPTSNFILLGRFSKKELGTEGYQLSATRRFVRLSAHQPAGLFYAVQSLLQLMPPEIYGKEAKPSIEWVIPGVSIYDKPRFPWRGMHLDVCRHFFPVEFIKKYIDLLSMYKMNTFHWHLTEDQGWRIEIKKYPKLTEVGAWRSGSMVGPYSDMKFDSIRYGGYYAREDIKEIVAYAAARYVTVVPEIEMPGHSLAALASYPELSCTGGPFEVGKAWGVYDDVYCPKESTFTFLENVLTEVCDLFPGKYIHIGGDECPKTRWQACASCQSLIKREGLSNEHELQSYFIRRIEKFLNARGKQIIGWDEILEGGLAPNAAVMSWRGTEGGVAAAKQRHNVVMAPGSHCYFDHYQGNPKYEPLAIGGYTTVEKVYSYEPVASELSPNKRRYIMGAQGNVWTEYIQTSQHVEYMALPRMAALAEVVWSPKRNREYKNFQRRLIHNFQVLDILDVHYSKSLFELKALVKSSPTSDGIIYKLSTAFDPKGIRYTIDGSEPIVQSPQYHSPLRITHSSSVKAAYFEKEKQLGTTIEQQFFISKSTGKPITLKTPPHKNYYNDGPSTLVNGICGDAQRFGKDWLGFWGPNLEAVIDLRRQEKISKVTMDVFNGEGSWIYPPISIEVYVSNDNITFMSVKKVSAQEIIQAGNVIEMNIGEQTTRYVKIIAESAGNVPDGKPGAGNNAWLFVDEIIIE